MTWRLLMNRAYLLLAFLKFHVSGRVLSYPCVIQVQTQSFCYAHCPICPYTEIHKTLPQGTMTEEVFRKITEEIARAPWVAKLVMMLQNEPLLDKRLWGFIRNFKRLNPGKSVVVVTTGEWIDEFSVDDIICSQVDEIVISLNAGSSETFQVINAGIDYDRVRRNIDLLLTTGALKPKIVVRFALVRQNQGEIHQAIQYWRKRGVRVDIQEISNRTGLVKRFNDFAVSGPGGGCVRSVSRKVVSFLIKKVLCCPLPFQSLTILYNGDILLCCHDWRRGEIVGNIAESSIKLLWNSPHFNSLRLRISKREYHTIAPCKGCSIHAIAME